MADLQVPLTGFILEFQVLTAGYKAEFGHGSAVWVNVVSKSGTNQLHGLVSVFHRNNVFDSSDVRASCSLLVALDPSVNLGGPLMKDRVSFFGSLNEFVRPPIDFLFPPGIPQVLQASEQTLDRQSQIFETRSFIKSMSGAETPLH